MLTNEVAYEWVLYSTMHDCKALIDLIGFPAFLEKLRPSTQNLSEEDRKAMIKMLEEWKL